MGYESLLAMQTKCRNVFVVGLGCGVGLLSVGVGLGLGLCVQSMFEMHNRSRTKVICYALSGFEPSPERYARHDLWSHR